MTIVNIIDGNIVPDPTKPQAGDVYEARSSPATIANYTRVVVTNVYETNGGRTLVDFEHAGTPGCRERKFFPHFLASLAGCVGLGRMLTEMP
jgi:hypothetical protein